MRGTDEGAELNPYFLYSTTRRYCRVREDGCGWDRKTFTDLDLGCQDKDGGTGMG